MSLRDFVTVRGSSVGSPLRLELLERLQGGLEPSWNAAAEWLRSVFEADHCFVVLQHGSAAFEVLAAAGVSPEWAGRYEARFADLNPFFAEARKRRPNGGEPFIATADELLPFGRLRETPYFREFLAPMGVNDGLGCVLFDGAKPLGHISIRRGSTRMRYAAADAARLRSLSDILAAALLRSRASRDLRMRSLGFERLASEVGGGLVVFDARGALVDAAGNGRLLADAQRKTLAEAARNLLQPPATASLEAVPPSTGTLAATVDVPEMSFEMRRTVIEGKPRALAILWAAEGSTAAPLALPNNVHFTARERDVLMQLSKGLDNLSIARELKIGLYTTKDHVKAIFRKLGVHTRAEAVALLARGNSEESAGA